MMCSDCELLDGEIQQMVHEREKKKKDEDAVMTLPNLQDVNIKLST